jgi:hypothetical protein
VPAASHGESECHNKICPSLLHFGNALQIIMPTPHDIDWPSPRPHVAPTLPSLAAATSFPQSSIYETEIWAQRSDTVYQEHCLPTSLNNLGEMDKLSLAYLCEACDIVQDQANIAERRFRQLVLAVRAQHLRFLQTQGLLEQVLRERNRLIDTVIRDPVTVYELPPRQAQTR